MTSPVEAAERQLMVVWSALARRSITVPTGNFSPPAAQVPAKHKKTSLSVTRIRYFVPDTKVVLEEPPDAQSVSSLRRPVVNVT